MASYARQAHDEELLKLATRMRERAIRRCAELLQEIKPGQGLEMANEGTAPSSR